MKTSEDIGELAAAYVAAQAELPNVHKDRTGQIGKLNYKYADLANCWDIVRPILAKHGLAVLQPPYIGEDGRPGVTTRVIHKSGQWVEESLLFEPEEDNRMGAKVRALGSTLTYLRRYALSGMLGLVSEEDDDGAASAGNKGKVSKPRPQPRAGTPPSKKEGNGKPKSKEDTLAYSRQKLVEFARAFDAEGPPKVFDFFADKPNYTNDEVDSLRDDFAKAIPINPHKTAPYVALMTQRGVLFEPHQDGIEQRLAEAVDQPF